MRALRFAGAMLTPLQGQVWRRVQEAEGRSVIVGGADGWTAQAIVERRRLGRYLYVPYGPVARDEEAFTAALDWLRAQAQSAGCWFLRVEPPCPSGWLHAAAPEELERRRDVLRAHGYRRASRDIQPLRTRVVDLSLAEDALLKAMTGTNRTLYRSTAKRGITVEACREPERVQELARLIDDTARRRGFRTHEADHLQTLARVTLPTGDGTLFLARQEDRVLSGVLTVDDGGVRLFLHGATDPQHRKLRAQQSVMVTALLDARERGLAAADLFGIAPTEDPEHPWAGFTRFKASLGGAVVEHVGAWELPLRAVLYHSVRAAQGLRSAARSRLTVLSEAMR